MSVFKPTGTNLFWNYTSSWASASVEAGPFATASTLPAIDDDVWLDNKIIYVNKTTPEIRIRSLHFDSTASISANGGVQVYEVNDLFTLQCVLGISGSTAAGSNSNGISFGFDTLASTIIGTNGIINISASILNRAATNANIIRLGVGANKILNIVGNINVGAAGSLRGIINQAVQNLTINIYGDITGSSSIGPVIGNSTSGGGSANPVTGSSINIYGNVLVSGSTSAGSIIYAGPNYKINIYGNVRCTNSGSLVYFPSVLPSPYTVVQFGTPTTPVTLTQTGWAPIVSGSTSLDTTVIIYGDVYNNPSGSRQAIVAPRVYITASANLIIPTGSTVLATRSFFQQSDTTVYPATYDVYKNVTYGTTTTYVGTMTVPSASNVRNDISYSSGSSISINNTNGTCAIPSASHTRLGVLVNIAPTGGIMVVPVASQVSNSKAFDSYGATGTYSGKETFWTTPATTMTTGIGALISQSLDVRVGSITGSLITLLDTDTSNVVTRLQSIAGVADVGNVLTQSAMI